jgi:hypothetical protein
MSMSSLEVLQISTFQGKALLYTLGTIDHSQLMAFNLGNFEPQLPSLVLFQISTFIKNTIIHQCIID